MTEYRTLLDDLKRMLMPRRWLRLLQSQCELKAPTAKFLDFEDVKNIPTYQFRSIGSWIRRESGYFRQSLQSFGRFVDVDNATKIRENIDIREFYGVSATKSATLPLHILSKKISMAKLLAEYGNIDAVAKAVIGGFIDCVSREGDPVEAIRQAWDGRLYVLNDGGSHRFSAVWRWHQEHDAARILDCAVRTVSVSAETVEAATSNQYWMCDSAGERSLHDLERTGFHIRTGIDVYRLIEPTYIVGYPRSHPIARHIDSMMATVGALDFSSFVLMLSANGQELPADSH